MAILATGNTFATGDSPTATTLNNAVNNATFASDAVDSVTTQLSGGSIAVKDGGITASKLSTGGPTWTTGGALTATSIQNTPVGSTTPSTGAFTTLSATGTSSIYEVIEKASVVASGPSSTLQFNVLDGAVVFHTVNASNNWTLNVRGNSTTTLNSVMATGDSVSFVVLATQGATAYYQSAMTIDGSSVTPKWVNGSTPAAGNASSIDAYSIVIIKTASATYTVLASQTKFA